MRPRGICAVRSAAPADSELVLDCAREVFTTSDFTLTSGDEFRMTLEEEIAFVSSLEAHPRQLMLVAYDVPGAAHADSPTDAPVTDTHPSHSSPGHAPPTQFTGLLVLKQNTAKRKLRHSVELGMSIRSSHRGRGIGTALLGCAVKWARANPDLLQITLGVYAANAAGLALYRRHGFVEHGRLPAGLIHDDGSTWEQIHMHLMV